MTGFVVVCFSSVRRRHRKIESFLRSNVKEGGVVNVCVWSKIFMSPKTELKGFPSHRPMDALPVPKPRETSLAPELLNHTAHASHLFQVSPGD